MGGFLYKTSRDDPDEMGVTPSPYCGPLVTLIRNRKIALTEGEIQDRSKGDILCKGFMVLQTLWFMIEFFARLDQRLPVTELELVTLAYAVLNIAIYFFWWKKPQNVMYPFKVHADELEDKQVERVEKTVPAQPISLPPSDPMNVTASSEMVQLPRLELEQSLELPPSGENDSKAREEHHPHFIASLNLFGRLIVVTSQDDSTSFTTDTAGSSGTLSPSDTHIAAGLSTALAMVFGALHVAAWSFTFPSATEKTLWRASSLAITCLPVCAFFIFWYFYRHGYVVKFVKGGVHSVVSRNTPGLLLSIAIGGIYVLARLILLVEMFVVLRATPARVFETIPWTSYLPHF